MEMLIGLLNFFIIFYLVRMLFNIIQIKIAKSKDESQVNNYENIKMGEDAKIPINTIEMVKDELCGENIPKSKAFILASDDKKYYFCSWECREKFIRDNTYLKKGS
ncbi:MAG: transcriptional regulator [Peptococcales bacterium]|jgi:YHS domain-containing protein